EVHHWLDNSDAALDKATQAVQKIRELTLEASNDSNDVSERKRIKKEVKQLKEQLVDIDNTKVNGKYIINGADTEQKPIEKTVNEDGEEKLTFHHNTNPVEIEVADGIKLKANVDTGEIFGQDLFDDIGELISSLETNDSSKME